MISLAEIMLNMFTAPADFLVYMGHIYCVAADRERFHMFYTAVAPSGLFYTIYNIDQKFGIIEISCF